MRTFVSMDHNAIQHKSLKSGRVRTGTSRVFFLTANSLSASSVQQKCCPDAISNRCHETAELGFEAFIKGSQTIETTNLGDCRRCRSRLNS